MISLVLHFLIFRITLGNHVLNMLAMSTITGWEGNGYKTCMETIEFVVNIVNDNPTILPGYKLKIISKDEGPQSLWASGELANFWRESSSNNSISPIVFGPLSTSGCKPFAKVLKGLDMYSIGRGCSSPMFSADKNTYSNVVRVGTPGVNIATAEVKFIQENGWQHLAIFSTTDDLDMDGSSLVYDAAPRANVTVDWFDVVEAESIKTETGFEVLSRLKAARNRIILLGITRWFYLLDFYCMAHKTGISGPKYVFIVISFAYVDIDELSDETLSNYCDREVLKSQQFLTFFIGQPEIVEYENDQFESTLGHSRESFDKAFSHFTATKNLSIEMEIDYTSRFNCYDVAMVAILALNTTESSLHRYNMSIVDWQYQPELVALEVGNAFKGLQFAGLYFKQGIFSDRIELDSEYVYIFGRKNETDEIYFKVKPFGDVFDPNAYSVEIDTPIDWKFGTPIDLDKIEVEMNQIPTGFKYFILAFSILLTISEILTFCFIAVKSHKQICNLRSSASLTCCILLNAAAVTLAYGTTNVGQDAQTLALCNIRFVLVATGMAGVHGISLIRLKHLVVLSGSPKFHGFKEGPYQTVSTIVLQPKPKAKSPARKLMLVERKKPKSEMKWILFIFVANSIFISICLLSDPIEYKTIQEPPIIDNIADKTIIKTDGICFSQHFTIWISILATIHFFILLAGIYLAYKLRLFANNVLFKKNYPDMKNLRVLYLNYFAIFVVTCLLYIIFTKSTVQLSVMAVVCIFESLATFLFTGMKSFEH